MRAASGMPSVDTYSPDGAGFGLHVRIVAGQLVDAAEDLRQVDRLDRDAVRFEQFLAVADGVEGRGPRADGADAQVAQPVDDAANARRTTPGPAAKSGESGASVCSVVSE